MPALEVRLDVADSGIYAIYAIRVK